jgi:hypothetical protein
MKIKNAFPVVLMLFLCAGISDLYAVEKGGLRVEIAKRTTGNKDEETASSLKHVNRTMSLKLDVTNISMKDMPEATIEYVVLIRKYWYSDSGSNLWRYQGTASLKALRTNEQTSILLGDFHIGGWKRGTLASDKNMDRLEAWKVVIVRNGEKLEFVSSPGFDSTNDQAKDAPKDGVRPAE